MNIFVLILELILELKIDKCNHILGIPYEHRVSEFKKIQPASGKDENP